MRSPGDYVREELKRKGWSQGDLAIIVGRPAQRINELVLGKLGVSPDLAVDLAAALGGTAEVWLQREASYRLSQADADTNEVRRRARVYELAPVKEMQKRGWIAPADTIDSLEGEILRFYKLSSIEDDPSVHGAMRKTAPAVTATPAQRAWAFRVRQLAAALPLPSVGVYDESKLDDCRKSLRKLAAYSAGVQKVPELLMSYGIRYVVVEGLPGAKMDGFATWLDEQSPVIGMSLRFDRLDSFWFTLGHELIHITHRDVAPIDGDVGAIDDLPLEVKPQMERRADSEAAALFVAQDELESFILRVGPLYSTEKINQFANRIKMHPAIIIGQLKHRGEIGRSAHNKNTVQIREVVIKSAVTDGWGKSISLGVIP